MKTTYRFFVYLLLLLGTIGLSRPVTACGGLFCQTSPVDQNAERIIFSQNGDGTISALIQIQYTGSAPDFSWILPLPVAIALDKVEVPEGANDAFTEIEIATNPQFIPPPTPECALVVMSMAESESAEGGVQIFGQGEVGPYEVVIIGSEDPTALITWLRENQYQVTTPMEPLIDVYVQENFVFMAMRLQPDEGVQDIQPIKVTYPSTTPMIPLRLTAVAANPDMAVLTWIFADSQAIPKNYAHIEIPDEDITFFTFGGHNYRQLLSDYANRADGRGFVTEYAQPTSQIAFNSPLLQELAQKHRYLTRLNTVISPEEMTVDPVFDYDTQRPDISNVHDLSQMEGMYDCQKNGEESQTFLPNLLGGGEVSGPANTSGGESNLWLILAGLLCVGALLFLILGVGIVLGRRSKNTA